MKFVFYTLYIALVCVWKKGVVILLIRRLSAVFGRLDHQTLELRQGLNILQAPNEAGKSTWSGFLSAMFYGIDSRQRDRAGFLADKNRYAPWSGAAMQGRMDCLAGGRELTLTRETKRQSAPMGSFTACYAGTGDAVPGLTGQNCGETLLGVPQEVYERSALIRQAGLAVTQDAGLERRIVSLITSGEEDTSYSEASEALKKQLNRRQHNRTGELPAAEAELDAVRRRLSELEELNRQLADARGEIRRQESQVAALMQERALAERWAAAQRRGEARQLADAAQLAAARSKTLRLRLEEDRVPESETIGRLRGAIVNLEVVRRSVEKAREERDAALAALLRAEAAVGESPFAGLSAEEAVREAAAVPQVTVNVFPSLAVFFVFLLLACGSFFFLTARASLWLTGWMRALPWALFAVLAAAGGIVSHLMRTRAAAAARNAALQKRFGAADAGTRAALASDYGKLCAAREAARTVADAKSAAADALYASLSSNEQGILLEVRRFAPSAFDIPAADAALRECAVRRREAAEAETAAGEAALRSELHPVPEAAEDERDLPEPSRSREALDAALEQARAALAAAQAAAERLSGRIAAAGDADALNAQAEQLDAQVSALRREYAAIRLAMEALDAANTTLQNRFSPELARRAAGYFSRLTGGRYGAVVLDRAFHMAAEPAGDGVCRDAQFLSAGAADQLYLAVRLAICDLVLPGEDAAPIVLDDALASFDDVRCGEALRLLKEEARRRQILLFTCHSREAALLRDDPEVSVRVLTE